MATAKALKRRVDPEPAPYLRIFVPGKPVSCNRMYARGGGRAKYNGKHLTNDANAWEQAVWVETRKHMALCGLHGGTQLHKPLRIECEFYRIRANADVDNYLKCTLDGLKDGLRVDDRFYSSVTARRGSAAKTQAQGCMLTVWEAP